VVPPVPPLLSTAPLHKEVTVTDGKNGVCKPVMRCHKAQLRVLHDLRTHLGTSFDQNGGAVAINLFQLVRDIDGVAERGLNPRYEVDVLTSCSCVCIAGLASVKVSVAHVFAYGVAAGLSEFYNAPVTARDSGRLRSTRRS
jgi:hypothetical protein